VKGARFETTVGPRKSVALSGRIDEVVGEHRSVVRGARVKTVEGSETRTLQQEQTLIVKGNRTVRVDGSLSTRVGTKKKPAEALTAVLGTHTTSATKRIVVRADEGIVLECGESRVVIAPEEVRIEAKRVVVNGKDSVLAKGAGPALKLTGEAELTGKAVKLYSQGASLELTEKADLNGAQVNLNCGGGSASAENPDGSTPDLKPVALALHDDAIEAFAGKKYRLLVAGMTYEGTTDGEGWLRERVPAEAGVCQLTLWPGEYPDGESLEWSIDLVEEPVPAASTLTGALHRLRHLGYYEGEPTEALTPEAEEALRSFQSEHELEPTGELDAATAAKLQEVQGT